MAKSEYRVRADFDALLNEIHREIMDGSVSASYEDGSDMRADGVRCAVRVYERYSWFGGNRVSLNVTLLGRNGEVYVSAITSGGSQAVFLKLNTVGEEAFLEKLDRIMERYK